jgi:hypothetical protein
MKKVPFGSKAALTRSQPGTADDWVHARERPTEPVKRLTIDIPLSLHSRVKSRCALENLRMADVIREFLDKRFPLAEEQMTTATNKIVNTETQKHD